MISRIKKFFAPSTAKALKGFRKATVQLQHVVAAENAEIDRLEGVIDRAAKNRLDAFTRRDHAARIADKFSDLIA